MAARKKKQVKVRATLAVREAQQKLTRAAVAKVLGVSVRTVQRLEGKELRPVIEEGVHYFDALDVAAYAATRKRPSTLTEGELAAELCERFDRGEEIGAIVRALKVPWSIVRAHFAEWRTDLENGYVAAQGR